MLYIYNVHIMYVIICIHQKRYFICVYLSFLNRFLYFNKNVLYKTIMISQQLWFCCDVTINFFSRDYLIPDLCFLIIMP